MVEARGRLYTLYSGMGRLDGNKVPNEDREFHSRTTC